MNGWRMIINNKIHHMYKLQCMEKEYKDQEIVNQKNNIRINGLLP